MKEKSGIFIGRFQPIHDGHLKVLQEASSQVETLYILVGSANACRSIKNPWTFEERKARIQTVMLASGIKNTSIHPLNDYLYYDSVWRAQVREFIKQKRLKNPILFGSQKPGNNYLNWFSELKYVDIKSSHEVNSTMIRRQLFLANDPIVPPEAREDFEFFEKEKEMFASYPFPETLNFNCADALVSWTEPKSRDEHILLVQRKKAPGRGTWAIPGGFKNANETFLQCAIRELHEETSIELSAQKLKTYLSKKRLFDNPNRSNGFPRNTMCYLFDLYDDFQEKPLVKASDDAMDCQWFETQYAVDSLDFFDDHRGLVSYLTGVQPKFPYVWM